MLIETLILDGHHCMLKSHRHIAQLHGDPVRVRSSQLLHLRDPVRIIDEGRIAARRDRKISSIRDIGNDTPYDPERTADPDHQYGDQGHKKDTDKQNADPSPFGFCMGRERLFLFLKLVIRIIHTL